MGVGDEVYDANGARVWLVTGGSSGFGAAIAQAAMAAGEHVATTFRAPGQATAFTEAGGGRGLGLVMDLADPFAVRAAVEAAAAWRGRLDVVVNNAGAGLFGAAEELEPQALRAHLDLSVIGPLQVLQAALPHMRRRGRGVIFQMSSVSGVKALPGLGGYAAGKFALEGLSEALAAELAPLGLRVVIVEPGPFRTRWMDQAHEAEARRIPDYGEAHAAIARLRALAGRQEGDPVRAAQVLLEVSRYPDPPLRLPLGATAVARIREKLASQVAELDQWEALAAGTAFA